MAQLNNLIVNGVARFVNEIKGKIDWSNILNKPTIPTVTDTYNSSGADATSGKAVAQALGTLDGTVSGTAGAGKTLTAFSQTDGKVSATFGNISIGTSQVSGLGTSATKAYTTSVTSESADLVTSGAVYSAIEALPEPMVFKGSLGTGGTITALPTNGTATVGDTYKVITAGTYASKAAKVGDTFICLTKTSSANTWELIPSGDEPSGTVTSVKIQATAPINIDSSDAITTSGTRTLSHANSGVTAGTYTSVTVDAKGHVTAGTNPSVVTGVKGDSESSYRTGNVNITKTNIGLGNVGNFKAVSTVASQGLTDTEKSNARANIGAGTSSLTIGTTASTAMAGNTDVNNVSQMPMSTNDEHSLIMAYSTNTNSSEANMVGKAMLCTYNPQYERLRIINGFGKSVELYNNKIEVINTDDATEEMTITANDIEKLTRWDGINTSLTDTITSLTAVNNSHEYKIYTDQKTTETSVSSTDATLLSGSVTTHNRPCLICIWGTIKTSANSGFLQLFNGSTKLCEITTNQNTYSQVTGFNIVTIPAGTYTLTLKLHAQNSSTTTSLVAYRQFGFFVIEL